MGTGSEPEDAGKGTMRMHGHATGLQRQGVGRELCVGTDFACWH